VLRFRRHYSDNLCVRTRLYDGVRETLHALSARKPLAVATNKPGHWARTLCEVLELSPMFRWVLGEDDVGARKPDPKLLLELCRRAAVPVERTLFVGDSRIDWRAAEAAGMDLALCTYGYGGEAMRSAAEQAPATQVQSWRETPPRLCAATVRLSHVRRAAPSCAASPSPQRDAETI
jgi:HAD superfamily hydrolase (TIGR01509 family)